MEFSVSKISDGCKLLEDYLVEKLPYLVGWSSPLKELVFQKNFLTHNQDNTTKSNPKVHLAFLKLSTQQEV